MAAKTQTKKAPSLGIRRGDRVQVLAGKDKGFVGEVMRVDREKSRVYVEGAKMQKVSNKPRNIKDAQKGGQVGGIICLLYTSDAADDLTRVDLGGRRIIKKK